MLNECAGGVLLAHRIPPPCWSSNFLLKFLWKVCARCLASGGTGKPLLSFIHSRRLSYSTVNEKTLGMGLEQTVLIAFRRDLAGYSCAEWVRGPNFLPGVVTEGTGASQVARNGFWSPRGSRFGKLKTPIPFELGSSSPSCPQPPLPHCAPRRECKHNTDSVFL